MIRDLHAPCVVQHNRQLQRFHLECLPEELQVFAAVCTAALGHFESCGMEFPVLASTSELYLSPYKCERACGRRRDRDLNSGVGVDVGVDLTVNLIFCPCPCICPYTCACACACACICSYNFAGVCSC